MRNCSNFISFYFYSYLFSTWKRVTAKLQNIVLGDVASFKVKEREREKGGRTRGREKGKRKY